jgi:hypothetical protein
VWIITGAAGHIGKLNRRRTQRHAIGFRLMDRFGTGPKVVNHKSLDQLLTMHWRRWLKQPRLPR